MHLQSALSMTKSTEVAVQMVSPASLAAASIIFYHFLLSGDVELNPGPTIFYGNGFQGACWVMLYAYMVVHIHAYHKNVGVHGHTSLYNCHRSPVMELIILSQS